MRARAESALLEVSRQRGGLTLSPAHSHGVIAHRDRSAASAHAFRVLGAREVLGGAVECGDGRVKGAGYLHSHLQSVSVSSSLILTSYRALWETVL